ncbi:MAG: 3-oxoacid CoA-transferase subunit B [Treponema sp.]|nr:3-oxoacid CoA-transferase subunit B [Treponema sp.]
MADVKEIIAARVARELKDGDVVNLGIGLPTMVVNFVPPGVNLILHSENGMMNMGPTPEADSVNVDIVNAGGKSVTVQTGGSFFDICVSFGVMRGGHLDATILGALEVDEKGNIASWIVPGKMVPGMGGAMDLVVGTKNVIVAMTHTNNGKPKILKQCTLPYTAVGVVKKIITEMGVIDVTPGGLTLIELSPDFTREQVQEATGAKLFISPNLKPMR